MAQILLPASTVAAGSWTGGHAEVAADDDSFAISEAANNAAISTLEVALAAGSDPEVHTDHVIRVRWKANGGGGAHVTPALCELVEGTTVLDTLTSAAALGTTEVEETKVVDGSLISNYADLRLRLRSENVRRSMYVDLARFEIPDASGTPGEGGSTASVTVTAEGAGTAPVDVPGDLPTASVIGIWDARKIAGSATDPVGSWADTGPKNQDPLAQATSGARPTISDSGFGGLRSVEFDGVDDWLESTLDQTYSGDVALVSVFEVLTFPALSASAGVVYSTGGVPNKILQGLDDQTPVGFVIMQSGGAPADHYTATSDQTYLEATPSRFVNAHLVRDAGEVKFWENADLTHDLDLSADAPLNNMGAIRVGMREDTSRPGHIRVAYIALVDMSLATQAELLSAQSDLASQFDVPGFGIGGGSTSTLTVSDEGSGTKAASGGSESTVTASGEGAGSKQGSAGAESTLTVAATGGGTGTETPDVSGGSTSTVTVSSEGAGSANRQDGSTSSLSVTPSGVGSKAGADGASAAVSVSSEGAGTRTASGGATANLTVTATGGAAPSGSFGGSTSTLTVSSEGAGESTRNGGSTSPLSASTESSGLKTTADGSQSDLAVNSTGGGSGDDEDFSFSGGSTAPLTVTATGDGTVEMFGGSTAMVSVTATGAGGRTTGSGGATSNITVSGFGGGTLLVRTRLEGRSVSGFGAEGTPSGVGLEGTRL